MLLQVFRKIFIFLNASLKYHRYAKGEDKDNWLTVDPVTAEIRINKVPDRESPFLNNGTYYATILCLSHGKLT
jgi:hypothetical protein